MVRPGGRHPAPAADLPWCPASLVTRLSSPIRGKNGSKFLKLRYSMLIDDFLALGIPFTLVSPNRFCYNPNYFRKLYRLISWFAIKAAIPLSKSLESFSMFRHRASTFLLHIENPWNRRLAPAPQCTVLGEPDPHSPHARSVGLSLRSAVLLHKRGCRTP